MGVVAQLSERDLIERCRAGDPDHEAFRLLYERHAPELRRFLRRMVGEPAAADDALQETFVRAYRALDAFDALRPLRPWLFGIARRSAIEALRRRQSAAKLGALVDEPPVEARADERLLGDEARELVQAAVGALSPEHREVVLLRLAHGLRLEEVATALEVTERTVRNRLRAAAVLLERELRRRGMDAQEDPR